MSVRYNMDFGVDVEYFRLRAMGYDEELARVINFSTIVKAAMPGALVAAPSTSDWWYCM